jgi:hypothetical protein
MHTRRFIFSFALLAALAFSLIAPSSSRSAAAQADNPYDLQVNAWQCVAADCDDPVNVGGAVVEATSEDGSESYGTCTTPDGGNPNTCDIEVPAGTTVVVTLDESTIPAGFAPVENPIVYDVPAEKTQVGDVSFYLVMPDADPYDLQIDIVACSAGCEHATPAEGVAVDVTNEDGSVRYGSCAVMSDQDSGCTVIVPAGTSIVASLEEATIPDGWSPTEISVPYDVPQESTGEPDLIFRLIQDGAEQGDYDLGVNALQCSDADCADGLSVEGVMIEVTNEDGSESFGTCTTETAAPGGCTVPVPSASTVTVWMDESTAPAGYAPVENPIAYDVPAEQASTNDVAFLLVPVDVPDEPTSTPAETPPPAATPASGLPAAIFDGTCDQDSWDDPVVELTDLTPAQDDPTGSADAIPVETSYTAVSFALDVPFQSDTVLVVFNEDDPTEVIACGAIGGTIADHQVAIGLQETGDSGWSGIAYLRATPNDPDQTGITVFLAEGLAETA